VRRALFTVALLALALPATAFARGEFDPEEEFTLNPWVSIHIGPLDMSINKAVAYLLLACLLTILLGFALMRVRLKLTPGRRQTIGEWVYDIAQSNIAEQGLPSKAIGTWFPYVASLFLFIWVLNMVGFVPLPLSDQTFHIFGIKLPTLAIYAATSQLSVTLALALMTFAFTHVEGIRFNGPLKYFKSWFPAAPKATMILIVPLEILGRSAEERAERSHPVDFFYEPEPREILARRKQGYSAPLDRWLRYDLQSYIDHMLGSPSSRVRVYMQGDAIDALRHEHNRGLRNHGGSLWALLTLEVFLRQQGW